MSVKLLLFYKRICWLFFISSFVYNCNGQLNLRAGSKCMAGNYEGVCVKLHNCLTFIVDRQKKEHPPICSFDGKEPIVCCTSCDLVANISDAVISSRGDIFWKTGQKSWDKCLDYYNSLPYSAEKKTVREGIVGYIKKTWNSTRRCHDIDWDVYWVPSPSGGEDALRGQFPHMALLGYGQNLDTAQWLCGGSLINEKFILTAGHCISTPILGSVAFVGLGMLKRSDPLKYWSRYTVKRIIPHPKYKAPSKYHDIALLETNETMEFDPFKLPACLPKYFEKLDDTKAMATGWGAVEYKGVLADNLQYVEVQKFSSEQCAQMYPPHRHLSSGYDDATQMCYGDVSEPKDTCEGDSGGPLQLRHSISAYVYTLIGVTSYGFACGFAGNAGMYTRVSPYVPWIENVVWP